MVSVVVVSAPCRAADAVGADRATAASLAAAVCPLKDWIDDKIMQKIQTAVTKIGLKNFFSMAVQPVNINMSGVSAEGDNQVSFNLQSSLGLQNLYDQTAKVKKGIKNIPGVINVVGDDNFNATLMSNFVINKEKD